MSEVRMTLPLDSRTVTLLLEAAMDMRLDFLGLYSHYRSTRSLHDAPIAPGTTELEKWIVRELFDVWSDEGFRFEAAPSPREFEWLYGLRELVRSAPRLSDWSWLQRVLDPNERWGHFNDPAFDLAEAFKMYGRISLPVPPLADRLRNLSGWLLRLRDRVQEWTRWDYFPATLERAFPLRDYHDEVERQAKEAIAKTYRTRDSYGRFLVNASDRCILRLLELQHDL
jgi:hypothetical protein